MSAAVSVGTDTLPDRMAAIIPGPLFHIAAANAAGSRRAARVRSGPTITVPPSPPIRWHRMQPRSRNSVFPASGRPDSAWTAAGWVSSPEVAK